MAEFHPDPEASGPCLACTKPATGQCSQCKSVRYCSQACHEKDSAVHQILCSSFANFAASARPSPEHFRAIVFPVTGTAHFVWLDSEYHGEEDDGGRFQTPAHREILDPQASQSILRDVPVAMNHLLQRELYGLYVAHRDNFTCDGSPLNMSVKALVPRKLGRPFDWKGALVAHAKRENSASQFFGTKRRDITLKDFRHVVDFFRTHPYEPLLHGPDFLQE